MPSFTHLIIISQPTTDLHLKEYLDIALVSIFYDIPRVIFFYDSAIAPHLAHPVTQLEQSFNMLGGFSVPLFAERSTVVYRQSIKKIELDELKK